MHCWSGSECTGARYEVHITLQPALGHGSFLSLNLLCILPWLSLFNHACLASNASQGRLTFGLDLQACSRCIFLHNFNMPTKAMA